MIEYQHELIQVLSQVVDLLPDQGSDALLKALMQSFAKSMSFPALQASPHVLQAKAILEQTQNLPQAVRAFEDEHRDLAIMNQALDHVSVLKQS